MQIDILYALQSIQNSFLDTFFISVTFLGDQLFYLLALSMFYWCVDKDFGTRLALIFLLGGVVNSAVKEIASTLRPFQVLPIRALAIETAGGASFPSGHTQYATMFWLGVMLHFRRRWLYATGSAFILLIALSRMYLGVHWPQDILGGFLIGVLLVLAAGYLYDKSVHGDSPYIKGLLGMLVVIAVASCLLLQTELYVKLSGALAGAWLGYIIEKTYVDFDPRAGLFIRFVRFLAGGAGAALIMYGLKFILPGALIFDFGRYALVTLWVAAGAPAVFKRFIPDSTAS